MSKPNNIIELKAAYPELVAELEQAAIDSIQKEVNDIDSFKEVYPELYEQLAQAVAENVVKKIKNLTVNEFTQQFAALYKAIANALGTKLSADLNVDGFLLEVDDPFAAGALRVYGQQTGIDNLRLPLVLPKKDKKATIPALKSYIVRADGGGDKKRAEAARKLLFELAPEKAAKKK